MRFIKKAIDKRKTEIRKVELNKSPEVFVEFISNPDFKEEFLEFVEEVLNWAKPEKETPKICPQKKKL